MIRPIAVVMVLGTSVGCARRPWDDDDAPYPTRWLRAYLDVTEDGESARISAAFELKGRWSPPYELRGIDLGADALQVRWGEHQGSPGGALDPMPAPGETLHITHLRAHSGARLDSVVELPEPLSEVTFPQGLIDPSVEAIPVTWAPSDAQDPMFVEARSECLPVWRVPVDDAGFFEIAPGSFGNRLADARCDLQVRLVRLREGRVDPRYARWSEAWGVSERSAEISLLTSTQ